MRIIVVGAGEVGYHLAMRLSEERHDGVVIERDPELAGRIQAQLDVLVIEGNGSSLGSLERMPAHPHGTITWRAESDKAGKESTVPISPEVRSAIDPQDPSKPISRYIPDGWLRNAGDSMLQRKAARHPWPSGCQPVISPRARG